MATKLVTLRPEDDALDAIRKLLQYRISGAPVVDDAGNYLGVFSEKTSMSFLLDAMYEQLPSNEVRAFMNTDPNRTVDEEADLLQCIQIFKSTEYRRLPVLRDGKLVGQISRRDVLNAAVKLVDTIKGRRNGKFVMYFSAILDVDQSPVE
ncbi:CBS domain-containing protein [Blastopirellula sp. JC732]|uniref:CBS domain-containing protein n=1 Tax=Blastopirellula sediminis TaxID=2894196 RepID=A0A9X1MSJ4_9BACT|nr:CBS domain-containing protein [Blastopirellula sediminis]MCC9604973.1 CBS domain-containing protein [Blastopirellula sediminis]MCC9631727.1 CBS domain-containing protein [Blastopirellula sediminis]